MLTLHRTAVLASWLLLSARAVALDAPTSAQAQAILARSFVDNSYATRHEELAIEIMKCCPQRKGDDWTDGTPANRETMLVPCKITDHVLRTYSADGALPASMTRTVAEIVFFNDEYGDYTYKLRGAENSTCDATGNNCHPF
jgi:hypothetical protein